MSDRKVLNKYYPPDFDPRKIPKGKKKRDHGQKVRMMMPMSVRCDSCGEYIYRGKKFNSMKETVEGEDYLGIKIVRLEMRCTNCLAEFAIKTDPQNSDYNTASNCSRNFEIWKENAKEIEDIKKQREDEEEGDAMKVLENKTLDSKVELDILEALDEIKQINSRNAKVDIQELFRIQQKKREDKERELDHEGEDELNNAVFKRSSKYVRRIEEPEDDDIPSKKLKTSSETSQSVKNIVIAPQPSVKVSNKVKTQYVAKPKAKGTSALSSLLPYEDDE